MSIFLSDNDIGTLVQCGGKAENEFTDLGFFSKTPLYRKHNEKQFNAAIKYDYNR